MPRQSIHSRFAVLTLFFLALLGLFGSQTAAKLDSEAAQAAEENAKDSGGLLEEAYAGIDFSENVDDEEGDAGSEEEDDEGRFLPENMLSVVFTSRIRCFYEEIQENSILRGAWFLTTSEASPIIVRVKYTGRSSPLYDERQDEDSGGFTVEAAEAGTYEYCFEHINFPSASDLVITFAVDVSAGSNVKTKAGPSAVKPEHIYPLQRSTSNLHNTINSLETEMDVILLRFDRHVQTQDSTETRVSVLTFVETLAIAGITAFQIYFVRRLVNKSKQWV